MHDQKTEMYEAMDIGEPVDTLADLPPDDPEGQMRYVRSENAMFVKRGDAWVKEIYRKDP